MYAKLQSIFRDIKFRRVMRNAGYNTEGFFEARINNLKRKLKK